MAKNFITIRCKVTGVCWIVAGLIHRHIALSFLHQLFAFGFWKPCHQFVCTRVLTNGNSSQLCVNLAIAQFGNYLNLLFFCRKNDSRDEVGQRQWNVFFTKSIIVLLFVTGKRRRDRIWDERQTLVSGFVISSNRYHNEQEMGSVERGICPIAESIMIYSHFTMCMCETILFLLPVWNMTSHRVPRPTPISYMTRGNSGDSRTL